MKVGLIIVALLAFVAASSALLWQYQEIQRKNYEIQWLNYERQVLALKAEAVLPAMELARASHQYYVDNPKLVRWWEERPGQDAEWVEWYDEVILILKEAEWRFLER